MARARCPRSSVEAGQKCIKINNEKNKATFFSPSENRCLPASTLKPEEGEFVVDSGASMHMISNKDLNSAEMDTLTKSCSPTIVITANGEVQTPEEATVYVKELDIFLTMKVLDNTPAVLSLGKLCDEHRYSYELINGQKPHLNKNGIRIPCNTGEVRSYRGSRLVERVLLRPVLTHQLRGHFQDRRVIAQHLPQARLRHQPQQHQVIMRLEKERIELRVTSSPVTVSTTVDERSGRPDIDQARKNRKNK